MITYCWNHGARPVAETKSRPEVLLSLRDGPPMLAARRRVKQPIAKTLGRVRPD